MTDPHGWSVQEQMVVKRERWPGGYGRQGIPLVYPGQEVVPDQPVLRLERVEHVEAVLPASQHLSLPSSERPSNGQDAPETIPAGMYGLVVDITHRGGVVIESRAAVVRGVIGAGKQVAGVLTLWQAGSGGEPQSIPPGAILVVPGPLNFALLHQALHSGAVGIVASSIALHDFEGFLRADLLQLLNQRDVERMQAYLPPVTLLLTEGLGVVTMPAQIMNLLVQYCGSIALLSGTTSAPRKISPELIISLPSGEAPQDQSLSLSDPSLGAQVRVCSGAYEGAVGVIVHFYVYQQIFSSGVRARAARLCLDDGSFLTVPLALLERIS